MKIRKRNMILDKKLKYHSFRGSELVEEFLHERFSNSKVLVYFDPDVDGLISGLLACRVLSLCGIEFSWYINSNRGHGFEIPIDRVKGLNIFCVDFLITDSEMKSLVFAGCNVLSIDHHENGDKFIDHSINGSRGIIINNQYNFEDDDGRYLSGAGVVFESVLPFLGSRFDTREHRSLVGLTLLTDVRNIENINARLYLQELYEHPCKGYIGYLIENTIGLVDYNFGVPRLDRNYVDYSFSPIINSNLRFNNQDEVVKFILGSGYIDKSYHSRQKELVSKLVENSKVIEFPHLRVVVADQSQFVTSKEVEYLSNFVGLLASKYLKGDKSVIAYLAMGNKVGRASFRGRVNGLDYLSELVKYIDGVGHGSAFGIIKISPSKKLFMKLSDICGMLEKSEKEEFGVKFITTRNFSMTAVNRGYDIGVENIFCLSQHRRYIKYTGKNIKVKRSGAKYKEYNIDGIGVMCFDENLKPDKDLILPIIERGVLCFYLDREYIEEEK